MDPSQNVGLSRPPWCFPESCLVETEYFLGRTKELDQISAALLPGHRIGGLSTFVVYGKAGVGKTAMVRHFVRTYCRQFDVVFFLVADEICRLSEQYIQIALRLGLVDPDHRPMPDICREVVKSWLKDPFKSSADSSERINWLIVFDEVDNPNVLADFWPTASRGSILLATENLGDNHELLQGSYSTKLPPLSIEEAISYLKQDKRDRKAHHDAAFGEVKKVTLHSRAECLDGTDLAITQIRPIILRQSSSPKKHLSKHRLKSIFRRSPGQPNSSDHPSQDAGHGDEHSLVTIGALQGLPADVLALLDLISVLDPECIQEKILTAPLNKVQAPGFLSSLRHYCNIRDHLLGRSLIEVELQDLSIRVHRSVQAAVLARARFEGSPERGVQAGIEAIQSLWPSWKQMNDPHAVREPRLQTECAELFPHIVVLRRAFQSLPETKDRFALHLAFSDLLSKAAR